MRKEELIKFRILWWIVLGVFVLISLLIYYVFEPGIVAAAEEGLWIGDSPAGYAAWILGGVGTLFAIAGARLGQGVFRPGWRFAERMAERAREQGRDTVRNPALGIYVLSLGLIECTALIGALLYIRTGAFNSFIVMIGMALLGWLVVKPEAKTETGE